jgi:hypothetical protein
MGLSKDSDVEFGLISVINNTFDTIINTNDNVFDIFNVGAIVNCQINFIYNSYTNIQLLQYEAESDQFIIFIYVAGTNLG